MARTKVEARRAAGLRTTHEIWDAWLRRLFVGVILFLGMGANLIGYSRLELGGWGLRYLLIPPAVFLLAVCIGVRYVKKTYRLDDYLQAVRYLMAALLGVGYPYLMIANGRICQEPYQESLLEKIGGPGYVAVQPGNVVVLESMAGPSIVIGPGFHFISKYERIKEVISLDEQQGEIAEAPALTKDGIEVVVRNIQYRFRLLAGGGSSHSLATPHPYSDQAALMMVYNRTVAAKGVTPWHSGIQFAIDGEITRYINEHKLDQLISPSRTKQNARRAIIEQLKSAKVRGILQEKGAELLWFDIGDFEILNKQVAEECLSPWLAKWTGNARVVRSYGDAQVQAYQELGRAEGQAEMLISIVNALEDIELGGAPQENIQKIILARTAQVLEGMRQDLKKAAPEVNGAGSTRSKAFTPHPEGRQP